MDVEVVVEALEIGEAPGDHVAPEVDLARLARLERGEARVGGGDVGGVACCDGGGVVGAG